MEFGWGARIRTWEWRHQKPLPYRLATPQLARFLHGLRVLRNNDGAKDNSPVEALEREGKRGYNPPHRKPLGLTTHDGV
ncbi:MAG: hypothetical protein JWR51_2057 [Devosia sp.]|nr:hypothetical protein [Devosia sp.]